jgi:hypothetical protein
VTVDRIASDEPDQVGIIPQPIAFWHRGQRFEAAVSSTATSTERLMRDQGGVLYRFRGEFGRAWLADPCSMALHEGLQAARTFQDEKARADRYARRQAKAALEQEAIQARAGKPRL